MAQFTAEQIEQLRFVEGYKKVSLDGVNAAVYLRERNGRYCVKAFKGKARKPAFNYYYRNPQARQEKIDSWHKELLSHEQRKQERKAKGNLLKVGDILKASWGYDQTNIDYYEVISLIGKTMVSVRELKQRRHYDDIDQGKCSPCPGEYASDEETRHKVINGTSIKVDHTYARKIEPEIVAGVRIYKGDSWTAYH